MSGPGKQRVSAWKILGLVVGVIVICTVTLAVWAAVAGGRKFDRMQAMAKTRLAELKALDPRRPVLRGEAEPGNAWDDYALGIAETKKFPDAKKLGDLVQRSPKADPEVGKAALAGHGAALEHLRRGAGRASSRYPYDWDRGLSMPLSPMMDQQNMAQLGVLKARALVEEGKAREAAGVLLDVCQFGRDSGADGVLLSEMIGLAILSLGLNELRDHLAAGKMDRPALEDLARGLGTLDGSLPDHGRTLLNEVILFGGVLDENLGGGWGPQRMLYADTIERTSAWMARAGSAEALPWAEAQKEFQRIEVEVQKTWNPISQMAVPQISKFSRICRERRAQLGLLRGAAQFLATGEASDQDDPFGAKIKMSRSGDALKLWSVGSDGADDGGKGEWKAEGKEGTDIVLDVKK